MSKLWFSQGTWKKSRDSQHATRYILRLYHRPKPWTLSRCERRKYLWRLLSCSPISPPSLPWGDLYSNAILTLRGHIPTHRAPLPPLLSIQALQPPETARAKSCAPGHPSPSWSPPLHPPFSTLPYPHPPRMLQATQIASTRFYFATRGHTHAQLHSRCLRCAIPGRRLHVYARHYCPRGIV